MYESGPGCPSTKPLHNQFMLYILYFYFDIQALRKTIADLFAYFEDLSNTEIERFIRIFDKLFDCLNVRDLHQWVQKRKPDLKPYSKVDDARFKVIDNIKTHSNESSKVGRVTTVSYLCK